ncbi:MAG: HAMP domain-containing histidine kinase [Bacteroides sp.]|nr:HAMP domain-containing histidine kinase [Bacteroides sp.]MCM1549749.1 HAMP domain-containing histidine kinase [Clostridium sp.]
MRDKDKRKTITHWLFVIQRGITFFLLISFVVTCCMLLFLNVMTPHMGIALTEENISSAAKITFVNVVLISLICTLIDGIRRKFMIDRPVRHIINAAEKVMEGDFSVRIQPFRSMDSQDGFNIIIKYFNQMIEELDGIETLRTDFIANVSHELKTPLAIIQNYGTMLQQKELPEEKRLEYAKAITDTSRNLADLITNILKLNKLENQEIYPTASEYNLGEQLCECLLLFEDAWEQKGLEIETDIEEDVTIHADGEMLSLVWNNLFSNAVKFTESGGRISVSLKKEKDFAIIKVADTGCGISKETGVHMFEKFYQGDTSHATKGNGLGLALVKRVMDITGGNISVESELGRGSVFIVKIRRKDRWNDSSIS